MSELIDMHSALEALCAEEDNWHFTQDMADDSALSIRRTSTDQYRMVRKQPDGKTDETSIAQTEALDLRLHYDQVFEFRQELATHLQLAYEMGSLAAAATGGLVGYQQTPRYNRSSIHYRIEVAPTGDVCLLHDADLDGSIATTLDREYESTYAYYVHPALNRLGRVIFPTLNPSAKKQPWSISHQEAPFETYFNHVRGYMEVFTDASAVEDIAG